MEYQQLTEALKDRILCCRRCGESPIIRSGFTGSDWYEPIPDEPGVYNLRHNNDVEYEIVCRCTTMQSITDPFSDSNSLFDLIDAWNFAQGGRDDA